MVGETMEDALELWTDAGFEEANFAPPVVTTGPGNNKNEHVLTQSIAADECVPADSSITVTHS